jgi:hypothetical protein
MAAIATTLVNAAIENNGSLMGRRLHGRARYENRWRGAIRDQFYPSGQNPRSIRGKPSIPVQAPRLAATPPPAASIPTSPCIRSASWHSRPPGSRDGTSSTCRISQRTPTHQRR